MTDPAAMSMWSRAKQVATYIVRDWMLLDADERTMDKLVEEIELELDRSFEAGMRAASHGAPLIRAAALEEASEWKTMENAPKDGTHFLWCEELRGRCAVIYWPTYKECFTTGYWHPLPPPPAESSAA